MLSFLASLVELDVFVEAGIDFLMKGHTGTSVNSLGNLIANGYIELCFRYELRMVKKCTVI